MPQAEKQEGGELHADCSDRACSEVCVPCDIIYLVLLPAFTIQPHPATQVHCTYGTITSITDIISIDRSNNPAAEEGSNPGLMEQARDAVLKGVGHHVPDQQTQQK